MANKFTNFIFTTEGKDTITQVLAAKKVAVNAQLSINTVYTFSTKLSTSLVYTQISSLGPKQTKPIGTVKPQDNDTVEMRIQLDNADLTAGYNLQGVAIVGQYNGNSFVLGYINANETTNIPPYDGTQVQTVALDVSFAISDTNIVTINTQTAGMLTVDDYNAMVKLLETRVAPLATDSKVVHLIGNETISDIKRFRETIIGSVDGNAGTADYMNVHTISSDINLDSISRSGNYLSTSKNKTTSGKPNGTSEQYTLVVGGNIQLFNDMSTDALYLRNRIDSKTLTPWKKIVEDVDQTLNAKYNYAQLPTVNGSGVALQSDLAAETNSRSVADRDLKTSIALEAQTRSAADIAFGSSLAAEVAARSTADASATAAMTKEQAARSTADASITANLTTETSARSAADSSLQSLYSRINSDFNDETATRSAADSLLLGSTADLASQIAKERDNRVFNDNSLASGLVSEAAKRDELFGSMGDTIKATSNTIASVNAGAVHKSGDTMTGGLTVGGNPLTGGSGTYIGNNGSIELGASTAFIDFHGGNSTDDYSSRMYDSGDGLGNKIVDKSGFKTLSTPLLANSTNKYNLDTVAYGTMVLTGYSHKAIVSARTYLLGTSPYTANNDGVTNVLDNAVVTWERGYNEKYGTQTVTNLWESQSWQRTMRNGVWQPWQTLSWNGKNIINGVNITRDPTNNAATTNFMIPEAPLGDIPSGADLNSYNAPGLWSVPGNAAGLTNSPLPSTSTTNNWGYLKVFAALGTSGNNMRQEYRSYTDDGQVWYRTRSGKTANWGPWFENITSNNIGAQSVSTASKLDTARKIGGVNFDGSSDINLPGVNVAGNQSTSGNAATADKLKKSFNLEISGEGTGKVSIDGSGDARLPLTLSGVVHNSGNESIGGDKNFTGNMTGTTKINQILTSLNGNSVVSMRPDIQAYEYSSKGLTFRFSKIGTTAFVNISGKVTEDITSEEILMSFGDRSNAKAYASPYWAGGETTGYKGNAISLGQVGSLSIWDDGSIRISYRGPKITKGTWLDGSINYLSNSPLPANTILNNS